MSNSGNGLRLDQELPPHLLAKLKKSSEAHTQRILAKKAELGQYPDPAEVEEFDDDVTEIRFPGRTSAFGPADSDDFRGGRRGGRNRGRQPQQGTKGKGKGKGGSTGGGGKRPLPDPKMVHAEVSRMLQGLPAISLTGNVQIGEFNAEFMDTSKARYFQDTYLEIVSRFDVLFMAEVECGGVAHLAKVSGHAGYCSTANTRNQAVGFLVSPRMKLVNGPIEYTSIANVQGIPDLRPAYRLDLEDTVTGERFSVVALHLKSMRGGPQVTAVVRHKQFALLVQDLGPNFVGLVGGDLNYKIDDPTTRDADPMVNAGYKLVAPGDNSATQIMGSRIDGFFQKGLKSSIDYYRVYAYFLNAQLKRSFSDHATLAIELLTNSKKSNAGSSSSSSGATGGDADNLVVGGVSLPAIVRRARSSAVAPSRKGRRSPK